jgi:hypothetical protein
MFMMARARKSERTAAHLSESRDEGKDPENSRAIKMPDHSIATLFS